MGSVFSAQPEEYQINSAECETKSEYYKKLADPAISDEDNLALCKYLKDNLILIEKDNIALLKQKNTESDGIISFILGFKESDKGNRYVLCTIDNNKNVTVGDNDASDKEMQIIDKMFNPNRHKNFSVKKINKDTKKMPNELFQSFYAWLFMTNFITETRYKYKQDSVSIIDVERVSEEEYSPLHVIDNLFKDFFTAPFYRSYKESPFLPKVNNEIERFMKYANVTAADINSHYLLIKALKYKMSTIVYFFKKETKDKDNAVNKDTQYPESVIKINEEDTKKFQNDNKESITKPEDVDLLIAEKDPAEEKIAIMPEKSPLTQQKEVNGNKRRTVPTLNNKFKNLKEKYSNNSIEKAIPPLVDRKKIPNFQNMVGQQQQNHEAKVEREIEYMNLINIAKRDANKEWDEMKNTEQRKAHAKGLVIFYKPSPYNSIELKDEASILKNLEKSQKETQEPEEQFKVLIKDVCFLNKYLENTNKDEYPNLFSNINKVINILNKKIKALDGIEIKEYKSMAR